MIEQSIMILITKEDKKFHFAIIWINMPNGMALILCLKIKFKLKSKTFSTKFERFSSIEANHKY